jgi:hypothetical protein
MLDDEKLSPADPSDIAGSIAAFSRTGASRCLCLPMRPNGRPPGRAGQHLVLRRRAIRPSHPGGAWEMKATRGPGESYSDVILKLARE